MLRTIFIVFIAVLIAAPVPGADDIKLTQRDLMFALVEGLGWSFGLPDAPEESDYLAILSGQRKFRVEVEDNFAPDTRVIIEEIFSFGNFSGPGWVRVPNHPTAIPVRFNLPVSGEYRIMIRLFRDGHTIRIGDHLFTADGGDLLTDVVLGTIYLQAGQQLINLSVPARGGVDFIELEALPAPQISPDGGWNLDAPLSFDDMAVTAVQILDLHSSLPGSGDDLILEAEDFPLPKSTRLSSNRHLGAPSQGEWVSAGADPTTFDMGIDVPESGVYDLSVRCVGTTEISGIISDQAFWISPERRFDEKDAGGVVLKQGKNPLTFQLPPHCGIDRIVLSPRASSLEDFRRLVGLPLVGTPSPTQFDSFLKLLAAFGVPR